METDQINAIRESGSGGKGHAHVSSRVCASVCVQAPTNKDTLHKGFKQGLNPFANTIYLLGPY